MAPLKLMNEVSSYLSYVYVMLKSKYTTHTHTQTHIQFLMQISVTYHWDPSDIFHLME